jgi:hypothetical protein
MDKTYSDMTSRPEEMTPLLPVPVGEHAAWERQPGESARSFEAFRIYSNVRPSERSLGRAAEIVLKSRHQMLVWSAREHWVVRAELWDHEQSRVANQARLEAIKRLSKEPVEIGAMMLAEVRARIPTAAKSLERSPHGLAAWAEVAAKLIRDGLDSANARSGPGWSPRCSSSLSRKPPSSQSTPAMASPEG